MKKHDFILIIAVLAAAGILFLALYGGKAHGAAVQITVDGTVTQTLPLNEDITYPIQSAYGTNTLEIKGGCAAVTDADCPDKICVHHHKIKRNGESIICLPHKTVITVVDETSGEEIDA